MLVGACHALFLFSSGMLAFPLLHKLFGVVSCLKKRYTIVIGLVWKKEA
jgi:uncharacterized membrane protein YuzA (DUF378 family)